MVSLYYETIVEGHLKIYGDSKRSSRTPYHTTFSSFLLSSQATIEPDRRKNGT